MLAVRTIGRLDPRTAPDLQQVLDEVLAVSPWAIIIDLNQLTVLEPEVVPGLVAVAGRAGEADIGLILVASQHQLSAALEAADAQDLFEIQPTIEAALDDLS